ncbi:MAG: hypothetical protein EP329_12045 [Deltaproteobacteria bacterium]|nr:MAG: hypothetical protein EP329_12045 [Deltaproteobacteria bacterium]
MSDLHPTLRTALAQIEQALAARDASAGDERRGRPLPEHWKEDPVKVLIAMVLARPDREGVEVALAWFYGRGMPNPEAAPAAEPGVMDVGAVVLDVLRKAVAADGLETVRQRFWKAFDGAEGG